MVAKADKKSLVLCLTLVIIASLDAKAEEATAKSTKEPPTTYLCRYTGPSGVPLYLPCF